MKKKKETKKIVTYETRHHWHLDWMLKDLLNWFLVFIIITSTFTIINNDKDNLEAMYNSCVSACNEKHFSGLQVGEDRAICRTKGDVKVCVENPFVEEFDRTPCINSCNIMLIKMTEEKLE